MKKLIDKLAATQSLEKEELLYLLSNTDQNSNEYLFAKARYVAKQQFNDQIYLRGLIELSNYCKCDCLYCGIRRSNKMAQRYRLTPEEIFECCEIGHNLGFRTFVLQGGEDCHFSDDIIVSMVTSIKSAYPDSAITLSLGEKSKASYQSYFKAGADRYLLRHETADPTHYAKLHPKSQTLQTRMKCLYDLKSIGYQVGTGFMVGSPYQTLDNLVSDLLFIQEFQPHMVGVGPFLPHHDTPFGHHEKGSMELTLLMIAILRLMIPNLLIPSTTALGTIKPTGREQGILAGANVIMPNLSPTNVREKYLLYDNKISTGQEAAEGVQDLRNRMQTLGYQIPVSRGDFRPTDPHSNLQPVDPHGCTRPLCSSLYPPTERSSYHVQSSI